MTLSLRPTLHSPNMMHISTLYSGEGSICMGINTIHFSDRIPITGMYFQIKAETDSIFGEVEECDHLEGEIFNGYVEGTVETDRFRLGIVSIKDGIIPFHSYLT